jgi:hypothetical protein
VIFQAAEQICASVRDATLNSLQCLFFSQIFYKAYLWKNNRLHTDFIFHIHCLDENASNVANYLYSTYCCLRLLSVLTLILTASKPFPNSWLWPEKSRYYPTPFTALWRGGGQARGCFICNPEDLLNKNLNYMHMIIKSSLKIAFL